MADIRHLIEIKAPAQRIYEAITTEKGLSEWWTTLVKTSPIESGDAEFWFNKGYKKRMKIVKLDQPKYVEWNCVEGHEDWIGTEICFDIEDEGERCILRFAHNGWGDMHDHYALCNHHWGRYLDSLKNYCEVGKGHPHKPLIQEIPVESD